METLQSELDRIKVEVPSAQDGDKYVYEYISKIIRAFTPTIGEACVDAHTHAVLLHQRSRIEATTKRSS